MSILWLPQHGTLSASGPLWQSSPSVPDIYILGYHLAIFSLSLYKAYVIKRPNSGQRSES